ncbi:DegV family protein [Spiroplasma endosymbiont of Aspidapion aeneum]|uniref:DegV family protein n=1 Tax=Spiroplasma endosymbiont of Aspidapion aeneum TaxID=3066276 RepID=UPI00313DE4D1
MKVVILADSSVSKKFMIENEIELLPLNIVKSDLTVIQDDNSLSEDDFYTLLDNDNLKTSQSIIGDLIDKWNYLLLENDHIICCLLSKGLSGQFNTAVRIADEDEYKGKVTVIDTNGVSVVNSRIILKIKKLLSEGKTPAEIKDIIEDISNNNKYNKFGFIIPKNLQQLVKGGRVSKSVAILAKMAKFVPILKYDGTIDKETKIRLFKNAISYAMEWFIDNRFTTIDISYSKCSLQTLELIKSEAIVSGLKIGLEEVLPNTIITHTGRETFALIAADIFF